MKNLMVISFILIFASASFAADNYNIYCRRKPLELTKEKREALAKDLSALCNLYGVKMSDFSGWPRVVESKEKIELTISNDNQITEVQTHITPEKDNKNACD